MSTPLGSGEWDPALGGWVPTEDDEQCGECESEATCNRCARCPEHCYCEEMDEQRGEDALERDLLERDFGD